METDPARSGANKILLLRQEQLDDVSIRPGGLVLVDAALFSHPVILRLGQGVPMARIGADQAARWTRQESVVLDSACGEMQAWETLSNPKTMAPATRALARRAS